LEQENRMSANKTTPPPVPQASSTTKPAPPRIVPTREAAPASPPAVRPAMGVAPALSKPSMPGARPDSPPAIAEAPTHEEIARAAYLRWRQHGGDPIINWLEAERELTRR